MCGRTAQPTAHLRRRRPKGFTVFELLCALLLVGAVSLVLVAVFEGIAREIRAAMEISVASHVRAGLSSYLVDPARGGQSAFPPLLDRAKAGPCALENPCFDIVIPREGVRQGWAKLTDTTYRSAVSPTNIWTYAPRTGAFHKTVP